MRPKQAQDQGQGTPVSPIAAEIHRLYQAGQARNEEAREAAKEEERKAKVQKDKAMVVEVEKNLAGIFEREWLPLIRAEAGKGEAGSMAIVIRRNHPHNEWDARDKAMATLGAKYMTNLGLPSEMYEYDANADRSNGEDSEFQLGIRVTWKR